MTKPLNRAKCGLCGDIIVSRHRHDYKHCKCGNIMVDGGNDYWRAGAEKPSQFLRYINRKWVRGMKLVEECQKNESKFRKILQKIWRVK